eukprot:scaffold63176_cov32-Tisochrysis_lutea.AAC.5
MKKSSMKTAPNGRTPPTVMEKTGRMYQTWAKWARGKLGTYGVGLDARRNNLFRIEYGFSQTSLMVTVARRSASPARGPGAVFD